MLLRNYKFRLYPTKSQRALLERNVELCRQLYNAALEQRISAWRRRRKSLTAFDQSAELKDLKKACPEFKEPYSQVLLMPLDRLNKAFSGFFRRIKTGRTPGFPRFKSRDRYDSFTYPQSGFSVDEKAKRLTLSKLGAIKLKQWRALPSKPKQVTLKREADGWYAVLCCEIAPNPLPKTGKQVGIDVGLKSLVTCDDGSVLGSIKIFKKLELETRKRQRALSRNRKGSSRRRKCKSLFAKRSQRIVRRRTHELHQISRKLVNENDLIAVEDLNIRGMAAAKAANKSMRRNIHLAAWGQLRAQLAYKAEEAGREIAFVNPRGTTQECSECGAIVPKTLRDRQHNCPGCGLVLDRDHNAARNVLKRALQARRGDLGIPGSAKRKVLPKKSNTSQEHLTP